MYFHMYLHMQLWKSVTHHNTFYDTVYICVTGYPVVFLYLYMYLNLYLFQSFPHQNTPLVNQKYIYVCPFVFEIVLHLYLCLYLYFYICTCITTWHVLRPSPPQAFLWERKIQLVTCWDDDNFARRIFCIFLLYNCCEP